MVSKIYWNEDDRKLFTEHVIELNNHYYKLSHLPIGHDDLYKEYIRNLQIAENYNKLNKKITVQFVKKIYKMHAVIYDELIIIPRDICNIINEYVNESIVITCLFSLDVDINYTSKRFDFELSNNEFFKHTFDFELIAKYRYVINNNNINLKLIYDNNLIVNSSKTFTTFELWLHVYNDYMETFYKTENIFKLVNQHYYGYFTREHKNMKYASTYLKLDVQIKNNKILKHVIILLSKLILAIN